MRSAHLRTLEPANPRTFEPSNPRTLSRVATFVVAGVIFAVLATANAGGYRYGGSDQAFYIPAVTHVLQPATFPRDAALIESQAALTVVDEVLAEGVRLTGLRLEWLFFSAYVVSLALLWAGLALVGEHVYQSAWVTGALGAAFTMRHQIARTSANTFEPYFHPRMLAFALGVLAIAAVLRRRGWIAVALVAASAVIHTTTAIWFALLLGVALAILDPLFRRLSIVAVVGAVAMLAWAATLGPLRGMWTTMDAVWLQAVASKDSLFADQWPVWAWAANLGMLGLLWAAHLIRKRRDEASNEDAALVWGASALVALFVATLPLVMMRLPLAVEFQISRVFWLIDLLATVYLLAALTGTRLRTRLALPVAALLLTVSAGRAAYVTLVEHPERPLLAVSTPSSPWEDAMQWISRQPVSTHVLADPGHSWKYGTSVRVSGQRDVLLEEVKDSAMAIYSHDTAARVVDRTAAIGDFTQMTAEKALRLAAQYDVQLLVSEADLALPVAYRNTQFTIYRLGNQGPAQ